MESEGRLIANLRPEDKDAIILQAIKVVKWIGWMTIHNSIARDDVKKLKEEIETRSGMEVEEFT